jgi:hypothetical protein
MKKNEKTVKIWFIHNQEKTGYWSDNFEHFMSELSCMEDGDVFEIKCKTLTKKEFGKLEKTSHEFEGW